MSRTAPSGWRRVERALVLHRERHGAPATFWLRDDDAVAPGSALDRLLDMAAGAGVPLSLAVIPALAEASLRPHLDARPNVAVLQHGYSHANHAASGDKKSEFGAGRDPAAMEGEIAEGRRRLASFAGFVPIFVPPWNRIAPSLVRALPGLGFEALSTYGDRAAPEAALGLAALNTHVDPVAWHGGRGFLGADIVLGTLADRLERLCADGGEEQGEGGTDAGEPTGLLTHHLVHDGETFAFLGDLLEFLSEGGLTEWVSGAMLLEKFGLGEGKVAE